MALESKIGSSQANNTRGARVSIKDVAHDLKLSIAAVSRGLRDDSGIGEATRLRIKEAAARLGYVPNTAGIALSTGRTYTTLFVVPYDISDLPHLFHLEVLEGVIDELSEYGFTIDLLFERTLKKRGQSVGGALQIAHADGAIVLLMREGDFGEIPANLSIPFVAVNHPLSAEIDSVLADDEAGARAATEHFIECGHRVIAHVAGPGNILSNARRQQGYTNALRTNGIELNPALIETGALTREGGRSAMSKLLSTRPDLTAVFCCRDIMAVGAIEALRDAGRRIPQDVSIIGFDDEGFAGFLTPALTSVRKPRKKMGEEAARILLRRMLARAVPGSQHVTLKTELIRRNSVGIVPAESAR